jgi:hypothetical protein
VNDSSLVCGFRLMSSEWHEDRIGLGRTSIRRNGTLENNVLFTTLDDSLQSSTDSQMLVKLNPGKVTTTNIDSMVMV